MLCTLALESHVISARSLLNLLTPLLTGGARPLINNATFKEMSVFNKSVSLFQCFWLPFHSVNSPYVHYGFFHSWLYRQNMCLSFYYVRDHILGHAAYFTVLTAYAFYIFNSKDTHNQSWGPSRWLDLLHFAFTITLSLFPAVWGWEVIQVIWRRSRVLQQWFKSNSCCALAWWEGL